MQLSTDRGQGLLVGLALGDRNGGPVQMALALAEDLAHKKVFWICELYVQSYNDCNQLQDINTMHPLMWTLRFTVPYLCFVATVRGGMEEKGLTPGTQDP